MTKRASRLSLAGLVTALALSAPVAQAADPVGRIRGIVRDAATDMPLPAVTVTASSRALLGGPRQVLTNELGRYELPSLPPGEYTIEFAYPGIEPAIRRTVVRQGEAAPLDLTWQLTETGVRDVEVVERRRLTRPDSTTTGTVVDASTMNRLPTARSYQGSAQLVPGVSGGANPNVKGGFFRSNRYMVDGLDVTDPVTNTFSMNIPFESMQGVEIQTGGMDAQQNALGGVVNVLTLGGSDEFHANASVYANHYKLSRTGVFGSQLYEYTLPFNPDEVGKTQSYQVSANVGGPIVKRKLWFRLTYDLRLAETSPSKLAPLGAAPYNIQHPAQTSTNHLAGFRLSYAPASLHRLWLSTNFSPGSFNNTSGGNSRLGPAENHQNQNAIFGVLGWDWFLSGNVSTQLQGGYLYELIETGPQGWLGTIDYTGCDQFPGEICAYDRNRPQHVNLVDNTVWYNGGAYQNDKRWRVQLDPTVTIRGTAAGQHEIKFGIQSQFNYRTRVIQTPGRQNYTDNAAGLRLHEGLCDPMTNANGACFRRTESEDVDVKEKAFGVGIFAQDRWWTPIEQITVIPGMRADYGTSYDRNGRQVTELFALAPRLGITGNLTRDGRNVLFAHYGRTTETLTLLVASGIDATEAGRTIEYQWSNTTRDFTNKISESGGTGGVEIDKGGTAPHADELTAGFRREIFPNTVASIEYTHKKFSNIWAATEINRIWDPTGSRVVGWKDPARAGRDVTLYSTPDGNYRKYHGILLSSEGQPSESWVYGASYNLSWTYGPGESILGANAWDNPRQARFFKGFHPEDLRHYLRLYAASYITRFINLGGFFTYISGAPATKSYYAAFDGGFFNRRSPFGTAPTAPNDIESIGELRFPDQVNLDATLRINVLPRPSMGRLNLVVDVFNILNLRTATAFNTADRANYGMVTGRKAPLRVQLALNYAY